jgi:hypothetical protein
MPCKHHTWQQHSTHMSKMELKTCVKTKHGCPLGKRDAAQTPDMPRDFPAIDCFRRAR